MRIHVNRHNPLPLENSIQLPESFTGLTLAEAVRFGIVDGENGQQARNALFKAFYLICLKLKVDKMIICARSPLHKLYLNLLFDDLFPSEEFIEMAHIGNIPHRVLKLRVCDVEPLWREAKHPLYHFFFNVHHPDLEGFWQ